MAYHNAKIIPKEFTEDDKNVINNCYDELKNIENNFNLNDEIILKFLSAIGKDTLEKAFKVLEKFIQIPFYINYKDKKPDENCIEIIKKACILKLILHEYKNINDNIIYKKIKYFEEKEEEFKKIEDKKVRMFALIDTTKYLLTSEEKDNFNYILINMEDLPEKSPFIESEIKFRKIISELTEKSKLSFLYLQLNSGAGKDLFSLKTFYKIKMIPLISIKNHILNDFSPYFYIYSTSNFTNLAITNQQTNLKSYNDFYLKRGKENITFHQSNLNTVKLLFLKFREYSLSTFCSNYNFELSPQIVFKPNSGKINLRNKYNNYLYKYVLQNEDIYTEDYDDENYIDIIYHYLEDVEDDIVKNYTEENVGESGTAIEYYLSNNFYCVNGLVRYQGDLNKLLNINLYTGESLLSLKRIIERKLKILYKEHPELIKKIYSGDNDNYQFKEIKKGPGEMLTHNDVGLLILE